MTAVKAFYLVDGDQLVCEGCYEAFRHEGGVVSVVAVNVYVKCEVCKGVRE